MRGKRRGTKLFTKLVSFGLKPNPSLTPREAYSADRVENGCHPERENS